MDESNSNSARQILETLIAEWTDAAEARDLPRLMRLIDDEAVFLAPASPPIRGKQAVEAMFRNVWQKVQRHTQHFVIHEAWISGDCLIAWGEDSAAMQVAGADEPVNYSGHGMMILRKHPDGVWKFARGINNMIRV